MFSGSGAPLPMARTAYSCHVAGRNCIGPDSTIETGVAVQHAVVGVRHGGVAVVAVEQRTEDRGFATPDHFGFDDPPPRAWSDSMRPIPASTAQLRWQLGAALASAAPHSMYAASASRRNRAWSLTTRERRATREAVLAKGTPTDAGCRAAAGTSQLAGAMTVLGVACGCEDDAAAAAGYVTPVSASFASCMGAATARRSTPRHGCREVRQATRRTLGQHERGSPERNRRTEAPGSARVAKCAGCPRGEPWLHAGHASTPDVLSGPNGLQLPTG